MRMAFVHRNAARHSLPIPANAAFDVEINATAQRCGEADLRLCEAD